MSLSDKLTYLETKLDHHIEHFENARQENRRKSFRLKLLGTALSALITISLGVQGFTAVIQLGLKNLALILSAFFTVLGTWEAFYDNRSLWLRYTETGNRLKGLKSDFEYLVAAGNASEERVDDLYKNLKTVLEETNAEWGKIRKQSSALGPKADPFART